MKNLCVPALLFFMGSLYAQTINITGTVVDSTGAGLAEATVSLPGKGLTTISGPDGSFSLNSSSVVAHPFRVGPAGAILLTNGMLRFDLPGQADVAVLIHDIRGRQVWAQKKTLAAGVVVLPLPLKSLGSQALLLEVVAGKKYFRRTIYAMHAGVSQVPDRMDRGERAGINSGLEKTAAALDTVTAFMGGYVKTAIDISSYTGTYTITLHRVPFLIAQDRLTTWNPGIRADRQGKLALRADGLPDRTAIYATLNPGANIQNAINSCPEGKVVVLNPGTFTISATLQIDKGIVLRGSGSQGGPTGTTIVKTGGQTVIGIGEDRDSPCYGGTGISLTQDGQKESRIVTIGSAASNFSVGDLALIDAVDDATIQQGDGIYFKRVSGRSCSQRVEIVAIDAAKGQLILDAPLHWNYKSASPYLAQIVRITRPIIRWAGIENLRIQGGTNPGYNGQMAGGIDISNAAYCWVKDVQTDSTIGGMHVCLTATYRCVVRDGYFHHSANYGFGADCYGIVLRCGAAENLVENNVVRYMNKPILFNVTGGGNVVGYNYADNSWATPPAWQEVNIDCHCSFPHMELIEGNEAPHMGASTTHGNAGYLTFFRNYSSSRFASPPVYGSTAAQTGNVTALEFDGGDIGMNVVGNVLGTAGVSTAYDAYSSGPRSIYELGANGTGATDVSAVSLVRQGNYDYVNNKTMWYPSTAQTSLPASLYLPAKPAWWPAGSPWPWSGSDLSPMVGTLPAKSRAQ